jgi:hypothetical protein
MMYAWCGVDKSLAPFLIGCRILRGRAVINQPNIFMDKNFDPGRILRKSDYTKSTYLDLALGVLVSFLIVFVAFVIPLLK